MDIAHVPDLPIPANNLPNKQTNKVERSCSLALLCSPAPAHSPSHSHQLLMLSVLVVVLYASPSVCHPLHRHRGLRNTEMEDGKTIGCSVQLCVCVRESVYSRCSCVFVCKRVCVSVCVC